jgi:excisionase family DNA binding protein
MARRDRQSGHEVSRLLEFVQATAEAAQLPTSADDTAVSPPKPTRDEVARLELTPREAAMRMNCSEQYVRRLCSQNRIPARRVGRLWLIDADGIDRPTPRSTK